MKKFYALLLFNLISLYLYSDTCNFPFPQAVNYPYGIKPNNYTQEQMNQHCQNWFDQWKNHYVHGKAQDPWMAADEYRVVRYETGDNNTEDTVSEGIGYGMIIMVYMSSATNNTKQYFDGMWKFYKRYMNGNGLMNWRIADGGGVIGTGAATDADEDVAFALIMAHYQWGSGGAINYRQEALTLIDAILRHEVTNNNDIRPGDGWDFGNISYFAPAYYRMFGDFTGETRWYQVAQRTYNTIINYYKNHPDTYNPETGLYTWLMPNWCNYDGTRNDSNDSWAMDSYSYWWDACRTPWRLTYDYLLYGTLNHQYAYECPSTISNFFKIKYNGVSTQIKSHYALNGNEKTYCRKDRSPDLCDEDVMNLPPLQGAIAVAAMTTGDQQWLNTCYENLINFPFPTDTGVNWGTDYFSDILKMLYLLVLTGNMKNPLGDYPTPTPTNTWNPLTPTPTFTPTPLPGLFDDFETGILKEPSSIGDGCNPVLENSPDDKYSGLRSMKLPFSPCAPGGWGSYLSIGSPYTTATAPEYWRDFTGATSFSFWIKASAGTVFFIKVEEFESGLGGSNPDGEDWSNRSMPFTKTGNLWEKFTVTLSTLSVDPYSGRQNGNKIINVEKIERVGFQFSGGTTGPVYIDDIIFWGMPTYTPTKTFTTTFTFTSTPSYTRTNTSTTTHTYTKTFTTTNTLTYTFTGTITYTSTNSFTITSTKTYTYTLTNTYTSTATYSYTATPSNTETASKTVTGTQPPTWTFTYTPTITNTFTITFTTTPTMTHTQTSTNTWTSTATYNYTATPSNTETASKTVTGTQPPTWTFTYTPTITNTFTITFTNTLTPTQSFTFQITLTFSNTNSPTLTFTQTSNMTFTYTATYTNSQTPVFTATNTFTNTPVNTPVPEDDKEEKFLIKNIKIYPNPYNARDYLNIKINITKKCKKIDVKIYTTSLRLVINKQITGDFGFGDIDILIESKNFMRLSNGIYYFVVNFTDINNNNISSKPQILLLLK